MSKPKSLLQKIIDGSPRIDFEEFVKTFEGAVHVGRESMDLAMYDARHNKPCVIVIDDRWWAIIENLRHWVDVLKVIQTEEERERIEKQ